MFQYFVRRCLLAIPTFIGATIVIFFVVQIAPGGAYEQQLNALRKGQGAEGCGIGNRDGRDVVTTVAT